MIAALDNKAVVILQRLYDQNPEAFGQMIDWLANPRHAFSLTLKFHGQKLKIVEYHTSAGGKQESTPPIG